MSDTKKTVEQANEVPAKIDVIDDLKKWITNQINTLKKKILTPKQVEDIAERMAKEWSPDAEYIARVAVQAVKNARPTECRVFLVNMRYELPAMGGLPMMPGTCLYKFLTFTLTEEGPGIGIPEELAKAKAIELGAEDRGLTVESLSTDFIPAPDQEETPADA